MDSHFLQTRHTAAVTSLGLLGMAFWASGLGSISSFEPSPQLGERILLALAGASLAWLGDGLVVG